MNILRYVRISCVTLPLFAVSCSNDVADINDLAESGITITDDVDCCSAEEALQVYKFLQTVKIIPELQDTVAGKYKVLAYSRTGTFHMGYNDIYFVVTKLSSGNYVKNFEIESLTPLMTMNAMGGMQHSTPVGTSVECFNTSYLAVKRGWISFLMAGSDQNIWSLSYSTAVLGQNGTKEVASIDVTATGDGQTWLKSFKYNNATYFISLVNPTLWTTGSNTIRAYVSRKSDVITTPYPLADDTFILDFVPTMPDMGGHTSPDNVALTRQSDGSYEGVINLTMTGLWNLNFTVKDATGNVVAEDINFSVTL